MPLRHVTLRQLKVFDAVARHLSFSRAAAEMHLSQPAVSMQVKNLEEQVGLPLTEQIGKKVFLTDAGRELQARAHAVTRELGEAQAAIEAMKGLSGGKLDVAVVSTAKYFAPQLLARFLRSHPGAHLRLSVNNREEVLRQLAANETDLAIMGRPPQGLDAVAVPFARNPHVVVAAPSHPLARRRRIPLARVAGETFIVREQGSGTRGVLERLFAQHRLPLNVSMEMASNETIKQAVLAEMGISFLSLDTIGLELETKRLVMLDVRGLPVMSHWHVVHLAAKRLLPIAQAFKTFLVEEAGRVLPAKGRL